MNREIKFRAWDTFEKTMWDVSAINFFGKTADIWRMVFNKDLDQNERVSNYDMPFTNRLILEQFTGLKDKNGKGDEIYAGSLIKRSNDDIYAVLWRAVEGQWWLREYENGIFKSWSKPLMTCAGEEYIELCGTIHDKE